MSQTTESFRQTLTSVERNLRVETWQITSDDLPLGAARWSVRKDTLHGGRQEGVDLIVVDNGRLSFTVIPTRGMSILKITSGDVTLGWNSPVREVIHPQFINLQSRGGLGWLEGFNEWLVRCGMEWAGPPGRDKFINHTGYEAEMDLTLHGRTGNIPASEVEVVIERQPPHRIRIRGRVDERMFYGPKLELWTELSTEPGANTWRIADTLRSCSAFDQEYQIIYHVNFGPPLLGKGARFSGAVKQVTPFNAHAAKSLSEWAEYSEPVTGFIEQVYCLRPYADADNRTMIMLQNPASDRAVAMAFPPEQLPYVSLWKNTSAPEEGYVTGLEPGTGFPSHRRLERKAGRVPKLKPGAEVSFTIDFALLSGRDEVARSAAQIARIQAGRPTQLDAEPAKIE